MQGALYVRIAAVEMALAYGVAPENAIYLRVGAHEETEKANRNFLAEGRSSWISAAHERVANRRREKG